MPGNFASAGYSFLMNTDISKKPILEKKMDAMYDELDDFLQWQNAEGTFLFEEFGLAEVVFTPLFQRFWVLDYFEKYEVKPKRVRKWVDACRKHPAAQQVGTYR